MDENLDYSKIAPYQDRDVRRVLEVLKRHPSFINMLQFVDLEASTKDLEALLNEINTIEEFQLKVSRPWVMQFLDKTTTALTSDGVNSVSQDRKHLFISNHRDIILDSAILNIMLSFHGIQTAETAIGDNLLKFDLVKILTKLNKNFTVCRSGTPRELYDHSNLLSAYIRHKITTKESSIWLAQKEGRAKDGNDKTQQGVLKMLSLSNEKNFEEGFRELCIRPMSLSYEFDPCDRFKIKELLAVKTGKVHIKEKEEDLHNIVVGILEQKGQVHLSIQPELDQEYEELIGIQGLNDKVNRLADLIDQSIYSSYKLFENNYVAYDLLYQTKEWQSYYSPEKRDEFELHVDNVCKGFPDFARTILLEKYAYPLVNQMKVLGEVE